MAVYLNLFFMWKMVSVINLNLILVIFLLQESVLGSDWRNIKGHVLASGSSRPSSRKQFLDSSNLSDSRSTEASTSISMDDICAVDSASMPSTSRAAEVRSITLIEPALHRGLVLELTSDWFLLFSTMGCFFVIWIWNWTISWSSQLNCYHHLFLYYFVIFPLNCCISNDSLILILCIRLQVLDYPRQPSTASSALVELTTRLDFFKERRSQLMEQLHNLDLNYSTSSQGFTPSQGFTSSQGFTYKPPSPQWHWLKTEEEDHENECSISCCLYILAPLHIACYPL